MSANANAVVPVSGLYYCGTCKDAELKSFNAGEKFTECPAHGAATTWLPGLEVKVKTIIGDQLDRNTEQVTLEASFIGDLGADSLDTVELVMAFEEEFAEEIPDEDAEKLTTVGGVITYLREKGFNDKGFKDKGGKE